MFMVVLLFGIVRVIRIVVRHIVVSSSGIGCIVVCCYFIEEKLGRVISSSPLFVKTSWLYISESNVFVCYRGAGEEILW